MALQKCEECDNEISSKANICPHCGCPTKNETPKIEIDAFNRFLKNEAESAFIDIRHGIKNFINKIKKQLNSLKTENPSSPVEEIKAKLKNDLSKEGLKANSKNNTKAMTVGFFVCVAVTLFLLLSLLSILLFRGWLIVVIVLCLLFFLIWLCALIDCVMNEPSDTNDKIVWILLILFLPLLGATLYLLLRRPARKSVYHR